MTTPDHAQANAHARSLTAATLLILLLAALTGCNYIGLLFNMPTQRIPAVYEIQNRPTVILVEDPDGGFETHRNARQISSDIAFYLNDVKVLTQTVDQYTLRDLASNHGDAFRRMPLDTIARELDAEQIIHIRVREVDLAPTTGTGLYRPTAILEVQVIDAVLGQRLFPSPRSTGPSESGYTVEVELPYHNAGSASRDVEYMLAQNLARRSAQDIAKLFFRHTEAHFGH